MCSTCQAPFHVPGQIAGDANSGDGGLNSRLHERTCLFRAYKESVYCESQPEKQIPRANPALGMTRSGSFRKLLRAGRLGHAKARPYNCPDNGDKRKTPGWIMRPRCSRQLIPDRVNRASPQSRVLAGETTSASSGRSRRTSNLRRIGAIPTLLGRNNLSLKYILLFSHDRLRHIPR
jgi:hypothetical protein